MKLFEYQAKNLFKQIGIPVPAGRAVKTPDEAVSAAKDLNGPPWVLKAQVHAGGRGKGGGVKVVSSLEELRNLARGMLEKPLVTPQTGPAGEMVYELLVEEGLSIDRELYLALLIDRTEAKPVMIFSQAGGMDIEEVAARSPQRVLKKHIAPNLGWMPFRARHLAYQLEPLPAGPVLNELMAIMERAYQGFMRFDCSLLEINPLIITKQGKVMAIDAKVTIDDNALFRHKDLADIAKTQFKDPLDAKAQKHNLNYIRLDGNIGAMVNGAGLAMATMDVIKMAGASPANFLDVGGGASEEMITRGFEIILADENVKAILINIFGGILRCDTLAKGVLAAAEKTDLKIPLIIRLEGTNVEEGRRILANSNLKFLVAKDMNEAAQMVTSQISVKS